MLPKNTTPSEGGRQRWSSNGRYFLRLWAVVTVLWTAATLFRIVRIWVPIEGWWRIVGGPWLWLELGLPPLIFGIVTVAVCQLAEKQRAPRASPPQCPP
jgi:hypothetical protein